LGGRGGAGIGEVIEGKVLRILIVKIIGYISGTAKFIELELASHA
jgi:hypothetical protein